MELGLILRKNPNEETLTPKALAPEVKLIIENLKNTNHLWGLINLFPNKNWNWKLVSSSKNITWDNITSFYGRNISWNWKHVSRNPNITWKIVIDNPDYPWDFENLSRNPNINLKIISQNPTKEWNMKVFSLFNPNTTFEMFLKEYRIVYEKCFNSFDRRYLNRIIQNPVVTIEKLRNLARLPMMENLRKIIGIFYYNPNCTFKLWKCLRKIFRTEAKLIFGESIVYNNEIDFHPDLWASVNVNKVVEEEKLGS